MKLKKIFSIFMALIMLLPSFTYASMGNVVSYYEAYDEYIYTDYEVPQYEKYDYIDELQYYYTYYNSQYYIDDIFIDFQKNDFTGYEITDDGITLFFDVEAGLARNVVRIGVTFSRRPAPFNPRTLHYSTSNTSPFVVHVNGQFQMIDAIGRTLVSRRIDEHAITPFATRSDSFTAAGSQPIDSVFVWMNGFSLGATPTSVSTAVHFSSIPIIR